MGLLTSDDNWSKISPVQSLILLIVVTLIGFLFIGPFLGIAASIAFFKGSPMELIEAISNPLAHESSKIPLFITQAFATFTGFIIFPFIYSKIFLSYSTTDLFNQSVPTPLMSVLVVIIVITFMGANSIFIEWNANVNLPESLSGLEKWAQNFEDRAQEITTFLTTFNSNYEFYIALAVIAILPALGEEYVFRGLLQNHLTVITKNIHLSVWVAAILFSFFHMQFYGFVPRVLLGALFGYLYVWSGNLAYPIIAHFVNNAFTLLMMYLYNQGAVSFDIESTESIPISTVLISMGMTAILLYIFNSYFRKGETTYE